MTADFQVHAYAAAKQPRRAARRNGPVLVVRVVPVIWEHALRVANGDGSRIRIISSTEVIVVNQGRQ